MKKPKKKPPRPAPKAQPPTPAPPQTPPPTAPLEEPPPLLGSWNALYGVVFATMLALILLFTALTWAFSL